MQMAGRGLPALPGCSTPKKKPQKISAAWREFRSYGTERMRQKLFVVVSGGLVNISAPSTRGVGGLRHPVGR